MNDSIVSPDGCCHSLNYLAVSTAFNKTKQNETKDVLCLLHKHIVPKIMPCASVFQGLPLLSVESFLPVLSSMPTSRQRLQAWSKIHTHLCSL